MVSATLQVVRLSVPGLIERPAVGTSCCASTAEAIVAQELSMLPGITDVNVDQPRGEITVAYEPASVDLEVIRAALNEVGYPAFLTG